MVTLVQEAQKPRGEGTHRYRGDSHPADKLEECPDGGEKSERCGRVLAGRYPRSRGPCTRTALSAERFFPPESAEACCDRGMHSRHLRRDAKRPRMETNALRNTLLALGVCDRKPPTTFFSTRSRNRFSSLTNIHGESWKQSAFPATCRTRNSERSSRRTWNPTGGTIRISTRSWSSTERKHNDPQRRRDIHPRHRHLSEMALRTDGETRKGDDPRHRDGVRA